MARKPLFVKGTLFESSLGEGQPLKLRRDVYAGDVIEPFDFAWKNGPPPFERGRIMPAIRNMGRWTPAITRFLDPIGDEAPDLPNPPDTPNPPNANAVAGKDK